jgi:hypothetical protein
MAVATALGPSTPRRSSSTRRSSTWRTSSGCSTPTSPSSAPSSTSCPSKPAVREKINWLEDQYFPRQAAASAAPRTSPRPSTSRRPGRVLPRRRPRPQHADGRDVRGHLGRNRRDHDHEHGRQPQGLGSVAAAAILDGRRAPHRLERVGAERRRRHPEGHDPRRSASTTPRSSGTRSASPARSRDRDVRQGDPMNEIAKKAVEHKRSLEALHFFGARDFVTGTPAKGYMGGLAEFITTNVFTSIGTLSRGVLDDKLRTVLQHGSRNKVIFAAPVPAQALSACSPTTGSRSPTRPRRCTARRSRLHLGRVRRQHPGHHEARVGHVPDRVNGYGSWMFVVDLDYVRAARCGTAARSSSATARATASTASSTST